MFYRIFWALPLTCIYPKQTFAKPPKNRSIHEGLFRFSFPKYTISFHKPLRTSLCFAKKNRNTVAVFFLLWCRWCFGSTAWRVINNIIVVLRFIYGCPNIFAGVAQAHHFFVHYIPFFNSLSRHNMPPCRTARPYILHNMPPCSTGRPYILDNMPPPSTGRPYILDNMPPPSTARPYILHNMPPCSTARPYMLDNMPPPSTGRPYMLDNMPSASTVRPYIAKKLLPIRCKKQ